LRDCASLSCRYHGDHQCGELESSYKGFHEVIDETLTTVEDTASSCQLALSRVEEDEENFATTMLRTTQQACSLQGATRKLHNCNVVTKQIRTKIVQRLRIFYKNTEKTRTNLMNLHI